MILLVVNQLVMDVTSTIRGQVMMTLRKNRHALMQGSTTGSTRLHTRCTHGVAVVEVILQIEVVDLVFHELTYVLAAVLRLLLRLSLLRRRRPVLILHLTHVTRNGRISINAICQDHRSGRA